MSLLYLLLFFAACYALYALYMYIRGDFNFSDIFGALADARPKAPTEFKDFGPHLNPLSLDPAQQECQGLFAKHTKRAYQCARCGLIKFVSPLPGAGAAGLERLPDLPAKSEEPSCKL